MMIYRYLSQCIVWGCFVFVASGLVLPTAQAQINQEAMQKINGFVRDLRSADAETLPGILDSMDERLADAPANVRFSIMSMAAQQAGSLKLHERSNGLFETVLQELDPTVPAQANLWRSTLTSYGASLQRQSSAAEAKKKLKTYEPDKDQTIAHAKWVLAYASVDTDQEAASRILSEELSAIGDVDLEPKNIDAISARAELLLSLGNHSEGLTKIKRFRLAGDYAMNALENEVPSDNLLSMWFVARDSECKAMLEKDPAAALELADSLGGEIEALEGKVDERMQRSIASMKRNAMTMKSRIETEAKRAKLVGQPAPELEIDAVLGGDAKSLAELKGKVVLIDFWAVWCGPCIATFPHLKHWHEEFSKDGLVILGVTNYYNYQWNEERNAPERVQEEVSPGSEQEMITKFAAKHELPYELVVSPKESSNSKAYGVSGIPQAVLIDRQGKVRMIKVGAGPNNAQALEEEISRLIREQ